MIRTPLCDLLGIEYPVFQGGMAWIADGKLAAAVSEGGGLGIIAAGNAPGDAVREQIQVAKSLTSRPFGVNIMLMSPFVDEVAQVVAEEKVAVVTTGAGNPTKYMALWKEAGIRVIPVVASVAMAKLMTRLGASALIAEGGESGGHVRAGHCGFGSQVVTPPRVIAALWHRDQNAEWRRPSCWGPTGSRWAPGSSAPRSAPSIRSIRSGF